MRGIKCSHCKLTWFTWNFNLSCDRESHWWQSEEKGIKWISRNWDTFSLILYEYKAIGSNAAKTDREFDWLICRQSQDNGSPYSALSLRLSLCLSVSDSSVQPQSGRLLCQLWQCSLPASTLWIGVNRLWPRQRPARPDCYNGISVCTCVCACAES